MIRRICLALVFILARFIAVEAAGTKPVLKTGIWKAVLQRPDGQEIVFNFETAVENGRQVMYVLNAGERLLVDSIKRRGDSVWIQMPFFASGFSLAVKAGGILEGLYIKNYGSRKQEIPFYASYNNKERYALRRAPAYDISGRWSVNFGTQNDAESKAVGEFQQDSLGKVTGTFLTATGDYRYLEGAVAGDSLKLSGFDGGHAVLFTARLQGKDSIADAHLYSGLSSHEVWTAKRNPAAQLNDEYSFTQLREGESRLDFSFPSTTGKKISNNDEYYKNKVLIIQILGSWCPNCMDETAFLSDYYNRNRARGVEVLGLAYERSTDFMESKTALAPFQKRFNVKYPFLVTGVEVSDKRRTEKTLPQLESIRSFPTTIFIDKKGVVRKIHSGFSGPGTGKHYEDYKKEFEALVDSLLNEG
ncbi:peroxiredoxin family protein [Foetidibacter luteolus]|uniref:peroxiredoxin family protein n=1 Tax=Foetidibacter luteolus TaxID=2608880 RepID=UPI00129A99E1|nr:TlpA disulfide reductase family protein [Foetidibacter luteolus]